MTSQSHASGPACLQVGPLRLFTPVVLAPMAGVTDAPFRRLCRMFGEEALGGPSPLTGIPSPAALPGVAESARPASENREESGAGEELTPHVDAPAGLYVMEMVTSRALVEGNARTMAMIRPDPAERVHSVQLYGVNLRVLPTAPTTTSVFTLRPVAPSSTTSTRQPVSAGRPTSSSLRPA